MKFLTNTNDGEAYHSVFMQTPTNANPANLVSPSEYRDNMSYGVSNRRYTTQL